MQSDPHAANSAMMNNPVAHNSVEILIAEDSLTQAMKLQFILEESGYRVAVARNGREALTTLESRSNGSLPTMVVTDIEMPEMNGYELCRRVKSDESLKHLPVILLTSLSDPKDVFKGLECGADNFVVKPYNEDFLLSRIDYMLANQRLRASKTPEDGTNGGIEIFFAGHRHVLSAAPSIQTTVDLLLGTYETAIEKNQELSQAKEMLEKQAAELREKNEHMQADLNLAREIQQAFLPKQYPSFPHAVLPNQSSLQFAHHYRPTTTLGGDFFDVLALSDTESGVFICDVMGHGVRSALVTAMMRALVGERTSVATDPGQFLKEINHHLLAILEQTRTPMFASAFYMIADAATGELRYANAGHPSPLWVRRNAGVVEWLPLAENASGPALGVFEEADYETAQCMLAERDMIVLFTDGLYEVEGPDGEYGEERLLASVRERMHLPPPKMFDEMIEEILQYSGSREFEDDVCLLEMELTRIGAAH
jgi:serine phosphatase RsbU (regulator of sigma subunit)/FixJ family two-component response regulator